MTSLVLAALAFMAIHLLVSGTPLRAKLVGWLGEGSYRGAFSVATFGAVYWLGHSYSAAFARDNRWLWDWPIAKHLAAPVVLIAFLLAVPALTAKSPTSVGQEGLLRKDLEPRGMQRITRHPFLCAVALWSAMHLAANGDLASIILFASFLIVALLGIRSIERKRATALGDTWTSYSAQTSIVPFAAIAQHKTRFVFGEIGWWRVLLALVLFAAMLMAHPLLFHANPLPGMGP